MTNTAKLQKPTSLYFMKRDGGCHWVEIRATTLSHAKTIASQYLPAGEWQNHPTLMLGQLDNGSEDSPIEVIALKFGNKKWVNVRQVTLADLLHDDDEDGETA